MQEVEKRRMIDDQYPMEDTFGKSSNAEITNNSQLPKGEKSRYDVQGKREDARTKRDGGITKVVDSSSHLPQSSPADNHSNTSSSKQEESQ